MSNPYSDPDYTPNYLLRELIRIRKRFGNNTATASDRENARAITERLGDVFRLYEPRHVYICDENTYDNPKPYRVMMVLRGLSITPITPIEIIPAHSLAWPAKVEAEAGVAQ